MLNVSSFMKTEIHITGLVFPACYKTFIGQAQLVPVQENYCWPSGSGVLVFQSPTQFISEDWLRFQELVIRWRQERGITSSITEMALSPAYQSIIGMGEKAIALILAEMRREGENPDQWFWALQSITGANPVKEQDRGDYLAMAHSWLLWAEKEGYAW